MKTPTEFQAAALAGKYGYASQVTAEANASIDENAAEVAKPSAHTNASGTVYFSTTDESGKTIYSFTEDFEDIWTQDDQDAIEAGSTPSKI